VNPSLYCKRKSLTSSDLEAATFRLVFVEMFFSVRIEQSSDKRQKKSEIVLTKRDNPGHRADGNERGIFMFVYITGFGK
jgi:hypothetical protein